MRREVSARFGRSDPARVTYLMIWMTFNSLSREFHISLKNQLYTMDVALGMDLCVNIQLIGNVLDGIGNLLRDCGLGLENVKVQLGNAKAEA